MIDVILDASVLCGDYFFRTPDARILRDAIGKVIRGIYVPQVALWEAINKNREEMAEAIGHHHHRYVQELARLSQERQKSPDPADMSHRYFEFINALTKSTGFAVLAMPNVSQEELVVRALQRRKPFAIDGRGHRDALIWHTVLEFAAGHDGEVAFITRNTRDFAQGDGLHPDLLWDLNDRHLDGRIQLFVDLKRFNSVKILPLLEPHERTKGELVRGTLEGFNLKQWFTENHRQILVPGDIMRLDFDVDPAAFSDMKFTSGPELAFINPTETRVLNSGDFFALIECKIRVRVQAVSDMNAFVDHSWLTAFWDRYGGSRVKYGDYSMDHDSEVSVELAIVLEKGTHRLLSAEQLSATGSARSARLQPPHPIEFGERSQ